MNKVIKTCVMLSLHTAYCLGQGSDKTTGTFKVNKTSAEIERSRENITSIVKANLRTSGIFEESDKQFSFSALSSYSITDLNDDQQLHDQGKLIADKVIANMGTIKNKILPMVSEVVDDIKRESDRNLVAKKASRDIKLYYIATPDFISSYIERGQITKQSNVSLKVTNTGIDLLTKNEVIEIATHGRDFDKTEITTFINSFTEYELDHVFETYLNKMSVENGNWSNGSLNIYQNYKYAILIYLLLSSDSDAINAKVSINTYEAVKATILRNLSNSIIEISQRLDSNTRNRKVILASKFDHESNVVFVNYNTINEALEKSSIEVVLGAGYKDDTIANIDDLVNRKDEYLKSYTEVTHFISTGIETSLISFNRELMYGVVSKLVMSDKFTFLEPRVRDARLSTEVRPLIMSFKITDTIEDIIEKVFVDILLKETNTRLFITYFNKFSSLVANDPTVAKDYSRIGLTDDTGEIAAVLTGVSLAMDYIKTHIIISD